MLFLLQQFPCRSSLPYLGHGLGIFLMFTTWTAMPLLDFECFDVFSAWNWFHRTAGNLSKWLGNYVLFAAHHVVMNSFSIFLNVTDGCKRGPRMRQTHYWYRLEGRGGIPLTVKVSLCSVDLNYSQTFLTDVFWGKYQSNRMWMHSCIRKAVLSCHMRKAMGGWQEEKRNKSCTQDIL